MNMMHTSPSKYEEVIDRRIIKEEYRNHDLVARYWQDGYLGKIWKNRKAVEEVDAVDEGIDDLVRIMKERVDEIIEERRLARDNQAPTCAELAAALERIAPRLSAVERLVLKVHAASRDGVVDMKKLQAATGYNSTTAVLMTYCNIAQRLCDEVPWQPASSSAPYPALAIFMKQAEKRQASLVLKKNAFQALARFDW